MVAISSTKEYIIERDKPIGSDLLVKDNGQNIYSLIRLFSFVVRHQHNIRLPDHVRGTLTFPDTPTLPP